ncbi:MAG: hypothetical protein P8102_03960 [Gammaproteobacteria bacterium]
MSLFSELKRRNVFRVAAAYIVTAWLIAQVAELGLEAFEAPAWVLKTFILLLFLGFPVALIFAWAFELTPDGLKREREVDRSQSVTADTGRKLDRVIIAAMGLIIVLLVGERFIFSGESTRTSRDKAVTAPAATAPSVEEAGSPGTGPAGTIPKVPEKSVAVLPFADLSQSQDYEWFVDGLTEEVLNALAQTPDLLVSSRTSSFRYKDTDLPIVQIAKELGVAHVLEGSVRRGEKRIRVTAQLIRASDGFHVWSESYDRDEQDIIAIQEDLAREIATALQTSMDPEALAEMSRVGTQSVEAYLEFLRGQSAFSPNTRDPVAARRQSYESYERARELDPGFARAHYLAARFWQAELKANNLLATITGMTPEEMQARFHARIDAAIRAADNDLDRDLYRATKAVVELRIREALQLLEAYSVQRPGDMQAGHELGVTAVWAEEPGIARAALDRSWDSAMTSDIAAVAYLERAYRFVGDPKIAERVATLVRHWRGSPGVLYQGHRALLWAGQTDLAGWAAEQLLAFALGFDVGPALVRARQACLEGDRATAEAVLADLDPDDDRIRGIRWHILLLLGRREQATDVLRPLASDAVPYRLAGQLGYPYFDPRPFPSLMRALEREGIDRPPPVEIPFACPPPDDAQAASDATRGRIPALGNRGQGLGPAATAQARS